MSGNRKNVFHNFSRAQGEVLKLVPTPTRLALLSLFSLSSILPFFNVHHTWEFWEAGVKLKTQTLTNSSIGFCSYQTTILEKKLPQLFSRQRATLTFIQNHVRLALSNQFAFADWSGSSRLTFLFQWGSSLVTDQKASGHKWDRPTTNQSYKRVTQCRATETCLEALNLQLLVLLLEKTHRPVPLKLL